MIQRLLHQLSDWFATGRLQVERRGQARTEAIFTSFDHANMSQAVYQLSGDTAFLARSLQAVLPLARCQNDTCQWFFSRDVNDIPPDADSTLAVMGLLLCAEQAAVPLGIRICLVRSLRQFGHLQSSNGGIRTYFGERSKNDIDPVVNLRVALLLCELNDNHSDLYCGVRTYLNNFLRHCAWDGPFSEYYLGPATVVELSSRLASKSPEFFEVGVLERLTEYLQTAEAKNALELAQFSQACGRLRLTACRDRCNEQLLSQRAASGWWDFSPVYRQRTPSYIYGSALWTSLNALTALRVENRQ